MTFYQNFHPFSQTFLGNFFAKILQKLKLFAETLMFEKYIIKKPFHWCTVYIHNLLSWYSLVLNLKNLKIF